MLNGMHAEEHAGQSMQLGGRVLHWSARLRPMSRRSVQIAGPVRHRPRRVYSSKLTPKPSAISGEIPISAYSSFLLIVR